MKHTTLIILFSISLKLHRMKPSKIFKNYLLIWVFIYLICSCSSQKTVSPVGNDFPMIEVEPRFIPVSIYACESIVKNGDTISISRLFCSDSIRFSQLFQKIEDYDICIEKHVEGTTYYSVKIGNQGGFGSLKVIKEVDNCFRNGTTQIESILSKKRVLEQEYYNSELIFYHRFRINKIEN